MGAACAGTKANQVVQDSAISINKNGKKHLSTLKIDTEYRDTDLRDKDIQNSECAPEVLRENEALWNAVELNDMASAKKYLDVNEMTEHHMYDQYGQTMVHRAAALGHCEIMMVLLERTGAKPDLVNAQLASPLHLACKHNRADVAKFLIGCGVDANCQDEHGQTPLLLCCIHGNDNLAQMLIEASIAGHLNEPLEVDISDHRGLTSLNCASIKGDYEMVRALVSRGGSNVNQNSPKGCTPLMYAGRGGYSECVRYLLDKKASVLKQDNAGGTVLHHAIEKGHTVVLETMLQHGVDIYSAIEIADNAGRTPLFEACENLLEDNEATSSEHIIKILTKKKQENGFGALVNVLNYTGQTPLFSAAREGNFNAVKSLLEAGAHPDLNNGELVKPEDDFAAEDLEGGIEEQLFMESLKQCMTPLHVAVVLGYEQIALYLVENGANVNQQTNLKQLSAMHLAVLSNKPELLMELLTKTAANPMLEDSQGRTLLDMVYQYIPSYLEPFQNLLEQLDENRLTAGHFQQENQDQPEDDDRTLTGIQNEQKIQEMYQNEDAAPESALKQVINLADLDEGDLQVEGKINPSIETIFGRRVALCLIATNWQYKEQAMKFILRTTEKFLTRPEVASNLPFALTEIVEGSLAAVASTAGEKVIKVSNLSLQLFNMVTQSSKVEKDWAATSKMVKCVKQEMIIERLILKSEESNTRLTNKIHESLLDFSYLEQVGDELVSCAVLDQVISHNQPAATNHKGLLAQLALLYKLVNSFKIDVAPLSVAALSLNKILLATVPPCTHNKDDIRTAAHRILVDTHKQTGAIREEHLLGLPEKARELLWDKIQSAQEEFEAEQQEQSQPSTQSKVLQPKLNLVNLQIPDINEPLKQFGEEDFERNKVIIKEKGNHRDWQYREQALTAMQDCCKQMNQEQLLEDQEFSQQCAQLLVSALEDNNIQIYLIAIEVAQVFLQKSIQSEAIIDVLPAILKAAIIHSTDTNTRVRKRSIELLMQVWEQQLHRSSDQNSAQIIAGILMDSTLNEKAIVGRLGFFIKKAVLIDSGEEFKKRPMHLIMGRDYEQLIEFACQWCPHKNTKVRQGALKLLVEVCRLNQIDQRGAPFKQRIVNFILGLRPSLRDPLVKKINEVCLKSAHDSGAEHEPFINESEMELSIATKYRAVSLDGRQNQRRPDSAARKSTQGNLPSIGASTLPGIQAGSQIASSNQNQPTIVLPHSEPLSEDQKKNHDQLIGLFGLETITCLFSQTWSSRQTAIQKVEEQVKNLDPAQRDAMYGEINRGNLLPENTFATFLRFCDEGLKDPVLKNYISMLELIQKALPVYFRYLRPAQVRSDLSPLIKTIVQKTKDLKQKVREASMNFCLYLSHQSPIGPEAMISQILADLDSSHNCELNKDVQSSFGNSHLIASCLKLLQQFQSQTRIVQKPSQTYDQYALNINRALKHQNPQVRRAGEELFKQMFVDFGEDFIKELKDQKPQLQSKIVNDARADNQAELKVQGERSTPSFTRQPTQDEQEAASIQRTQIQLRDDYLSQPLIQELLRGQEDKIHLLKMPNPKKRIQAIIEIKKIIQAKISSLGQQQMSSAIKDMVEPFSLLMRHLLRDDNSEVYLESLNLLKFIVSSMAPHMSSLDLHLMMGSFIGVILSSNSQTRTRVASDKMIIHFAKHNNIGSFVVAKEICKNIERLNKTAFTTPFSAPVEADEDKKATLTRLYNILQMLIQQFSIVLCYQPEFYKKMLESIAETLSKCGEYSSLKTVSTQLIVTLYSTDQKLLDERVQQLDFSKKANIKKIMIELQNNEDRGNQVLFTQSQTLVGGERQNSPDQSFNTTAQSFLSSQTRGSIMSPSMSRRKASQQPASQNQDSFSKADRNSTVRNSRHNQQSSLAHESTSLLINRQQTDQLENLTGQNWLNKNNKENDTLLPDISERGSRRRAAGGMIGGASKAAGFKSDFNTTGDYSQSNGGIMGPNFGGNSGVAHGLAAPIKSLDPIGATFDAPAYQKLAVGTPSKKLRLQKALHDTSIQQERPPLYVSNSRREPAPNRQQSPAGYQPSLLTKIAPSKAQPVPQEPVNTHVLLGAPIYKAGNGMGSSERRYRQEPPENSSQSLVPSQARQPKLRGKLVVAPPEATFQVKTVQEKANLQSFQRQFQPDMCE